MVKILIVQIVAFISSEKLSDRLFGVIHTEERLWLRVSTEYTAFFKA
jgi:hypothetical protein